jgi:tRNA dimethylallyltransferase
LTSAPAPWLAVVGPTASGKTELAVALALDAGDAEIVSADAIQVYREMDYGTAKPTPDQLAAVPHHLIDVVDPDETYSLARYLSDARTALDDIVGRGKRAIVAGGTGLYVQALVDALDVPGHWPDARAEVEAEPNTAILHRRLAELDPVAASRMETGNRRRIVRALEVTLGSGRPFSSFGAGVAAYPKVPTMLIGLDPPTDVLDQRIADRVDGMLAAGLADEARQLDGRLSRTARQALGYRQVLDAPGATDVEVRGAIVLATRQFARRQRRWFRRDPRIAWR